MQTLSCRSARLHRARGPRPAAASCDCAEAGRLCWPEEAGRRHRLCQGRAPAPCRSGHRRRMQEIDRRRRSKRITVPPVDVVALLVGLAGMPTRSSCWPALFAKPTIKFYTSVGSFLSASALASAMERRQRLVLPPRPEAGGARRWGQRRLRGAAGRRGSARSAGPVGQSDSQARISLPRSKWTTSLRARTAAGIWARSCTKRFRYWSWGRSDRMIS